MGKAARAQELASAFMRILALHRVDFPPGQRPVAAEPTLPDRAVIYAFYEQQLLTGIGRFQRAALAAARAKTAAWTQIEVGRQWQSHKAQQAQWQQTYDRQWQLLCGNDPDTVLQSLASASRTTRRPARRSAWTVLRCRWSWWCHQRRRSFRNSCRDAPQRATCR